MNDVRKPRPYLIHLWIAVITMAAVSLASCEVGTDLEETTPSTQTAVPSEPTTGAEVDRKSIQNNLKAATVQIFAQGQVGGRMTDFWSGSGTIISADGLILTNAHVASPDEPGLAAFYRDISLLDLPEPDQLVIALFEDDRSPAIETYIAEVVAVDGPLDLAVLQIVTTIDGRTVNATELDLPFVELGDSDEVDIGDTLNIFGFPGVGGDTITFTRGTVSGFESQDRVGDGAWIKTDTAVRGGNSGGLGANEMGQIIGVPSRGIEAAGGDLNYLRVINLAKPLIESGQAGSSYRSPYVVAGSGREQFSFETWAADFDGETGCALDPVAAYPSGVVGLVGVFDYSGMTDGEDYIETIYLDSEMVVANVYAWWEGTSGSCHPVWAVNSSGPLPDGIYEINLFAGEDFKQVGYAQTTVGIAECDDCVQFSGQIIDGDSGNGIPGAFFAVFAPGTDMVAWDQNRTDDPILFEVFTDSDGFYLFPIALPRGLEFPVGIGAEGYFLELGFSLPVLQDYPDSVTLDPFPLFK